MSRPQEALNLVSLAKAAGGGAKAVPGTALKVRVVEKGAEVLASDRWLLVLEGELIIDLPHGDFRHLKVGDSLRLEADTPVSYTPMRETVILHD
jgi:hypothetical protein